eukprot:TRINITY_DN1474_c0_g1_i4.p1 TRINITY_DN1474_c0_g1~~TRINITY_DN1474_c0_g1_i4.p1  ORF type:complete len:109 (+),score=17.74 TRINITY_DN1474_c0_g1_i4:38-328(+)
MLDFTVQVGIFCGERKSNKLFQGDLAVSILIQVFSKELSSDQESHLVESLDDFISSQNSVVIGVQLLELGQKVLFYNKKQGIQAIGVSVVSTQRIL